MISSYNVLFIFLSIENKIIVVYIIQWQNSPRVVFCFLILLIC